MRVTVFSDVRCAAAADGTLRSVDGIYGYPFWSRYLDVFDDVTVVSRFADGDTNGPEFTGPRVTYRAVPDFRGAAEYIRKRPAIGRVVASACEADSAFVLRMPGRIGAVAARRLQRLDKPYAIEVVGDPLDVFARGVVKHPLRPIVRRVFAADLKRVARHAGAALYVTDRTLQRLYPCDGVQISASNVELDAHAFAAEWKHAMPAQHSFRIVTVASLARLYKGPDVLLDAVARCVARGLDVSLVLVGDGRFRSDLETHAASLGLNGRVVFRGQLPAGAAVRAELDAADLFVLPSRADAMPRALIEAMARGLPCLGSRVGGIPELLSCDDLVTPGDSVEMAERIACVLHDPARREEMAAQCFARAHDFSASLLRERRRQFFSAVLRLYVS